MSFHEIAGLHNDFPLLPTQTVRRRLPSIDHTKGSYDMRKLHLLVVLFLIGGLISACDLGAGYQQKDGSYEYVTLDESQGYVEHPITDIDVQSFRILDKHGYARDHLHVVYHWESVEGADTNSFVAMSDLYGKDNAHVYYQGKTIPGADPQSFKLFDIQWGRDAQDVYLQDRPLEACDPASFVLLKDSWERDSRCVYRAGRKLVDADADSFVVLNFWFGKDKNHVYDSFPRIIAGADAATFKLREGACQVCAEDKNRCYRYEEPVDCASLK